jgi:hypothetical protein
MPKKKKAVKGNEGNKEKGRKLRNKNGKRK